VAVEETKKKIKEAYQNLFGINEIDFKNVLNKLEISEWKDNRKIYVYGGEKNKLNKDIEKLKRKYFKLKSKQK
jgi:glutaminase